MTSIYSLLTLRNAPSSTFFRASGRPLKPLVSIKLIYHSSHSLCRCAVVFQASIFASVNRNGMPSCRNALKFIVFRERLNGTYRQSEHRCFWSCQRLPERFQTPLFTLRRSSLFASLRTIQTFSSVVSEIFSPSIETDAASIFRNAALWNHLSLVYLRNQDSAIPHVTQYFPT